MKRTSRAVTALLFALAALACADAAAACSCAKAGPPCASFRGSPVVFVGTVAAVTRAERASTVLPLGGPNVNRWQIHKSPVISVSFGVDEPFKGVTGSTVELVTYTDTAACGFPFEVGKTYVVYAHQWKELPGRSDSSLANPPAGLSKEVDEFNAPLSQFETSICTRTQSLSEARDDLELIRDLLAGKSPTRVFGSVAEFAQPLSTKRYTDSEFVGPMAGVTVEVYGAGGRFEAQTDAEGRYRVAGLPPGKYTVRPRLPETYGPLYGGGEATVEVTREGCGAERRFMMQVDGRISGRVFGAEGRPVGKGVRVSLVKAGDSTGSRPLLERRTGYTDEQGRYKFGGVPPGRYALGVNVADVPYRDSPYPATFYPSAADAEHAAVIALAAGQRLGDLDLRLPPRLPAGRVTGVVLNNGRPAAGATVSLYDDEDPKSDVFGFDAETDARGRFALSCFKGRNYKVRANLYTDSPGGGEFESAKVEVRCADAPAPVSLSLVMKKEDTGGSKQDADGKP